MEDWFEELAQDLRSMLGRFSAEPIQKISDLIDEGQLDQAMNEYAKIVACHKVVKIYS